MTVTKILGEQAGLQYSGVTDKSEADPRDSLINALFTGQFKNGPFNKPFKITQANIRAKLGFDPDNLQYQSIEDCLLRGAPFVWVMRIDGEVSNGGGSGGGSNSGPISCANATSKLVLNINMPKNANAHFELNLLSENGGLVLIGGGPASITDLSFINTTGFNATLTNVQESADFIIATLTVINETGGSARLSVEGVGVSIDNLQSTPAILIISESGGILNAQLCLASAEKVESGFKVSCLPGQGHEEISLYKARDSLPFLTFGNVAFNIYIDGVQVGTEVSLTDDSVMATFGLKATLSDGMRYMSMKNISFNSLAVGLVPTMSSFVDDVDPDYYPSSPTVIQDGGFHFCLAPPAEMF